MILCKINFLGNHHKVLFSLIQSQWGEIMDNGYIIREKNHQTLNMWAFWACQLAAQTKSIYVEKNVAQSIKCTKTENNFTLK